MKHTADRSCTRIRRVLRVILKIVRRLVELLLAFLARHLPFVETGLLGGFVALLVSSIPLIGHTLAWAVVVLASVVGLIREVRA